MICLKVIFILGIVFLIWIIAYEIVVMAGREDEIIEDAFRKESDDGKS